MFLIMSNCYYNSPRGRISLNSEIGLDNYKPASKSLLAVVLSRPKFSLYFIEKHRTPNTEHGTRNKTNFQT